MSFTVKFTRLAEQDIDGIIHFIAQDNPNQALKFVDELQKRAVQTLEVFPRSGSTYKTVRSLPFDSYLVVYDIDETDMSGLKVGAPTMSLMRPRYEVFILMMLSSDVIQPVTSIPAQSWKLG